MGDSLGATSMLDRKYTKSDTFRLWRKDELLRSADFEEQVDHTEKFQEILEQMRKDLCGVRKRVGNHLLF